MKPKLDFNNIIYILVFLFILLLIIFKSINIHQTLQENFEENNNNSDSKEIENQVEEELGNNLEEINQNLEVTEEDLKSDNDEMTTAELEKKCASIGNKKWGAIVSKYSGRMINIDFVEEGNDPNPNLSVNPDSKNSYLYLVKWQPLNNKAGGCVTCNADGTYSTPMCDSTIQSQLWHIVHIKDKDDLMKIIPEKYQKFGRDMDTTEYPFNIVLSSKYNNNRYVLNYEGGGLSIRPIANYDGIRWDVSNEPIKQEVLPTQNNSKYTSLTPEHNITKSDTSLNKFFQKSNLDSNNSNNSNNNNNKNGDGVNFNINLDPELIQKLGLGMGLSGGDMTGNSGNTMLNIEEGNNNESSKNSNTGLVENTDVSKEADVLLTPEELNKRKFAKNKYGGRGNVSDMVMEGANEDPCTSCGKVPPNYIKKDMVKSMCIGCNDIDNIST